MPRGQPRTATELLTLIGGFIAAVGAIFTALTQTFDGVGKIVATRIRLPPGGWWALAALLAILALVAVRSGLARRSRLLQPAALHLSPDRTEHLHGRAEDVDRVVDLCIGRAQVNLVGESGTGKSALIRSGVLPRLAARRDLLAVYVDAWGHDWEEGPRRAVRDRLIRALDDGERAAIDATVGDVPQLLRRIRTILSRTPVLIFDQFDDYQVQHKSRFLPPLTRTWIGTDELVAQNKLWRELRDLVADDTIHCLFATRADASPGLESVRLARPVTYNLDRLESVFVVPLLDALTREDIVAFPENGWNQLKLRLARDLAAAGAVLPAQMKLALKGLASLTYLTVAEYDRQGGLGGLEAADVERHVGTAVRSCGVTKDEAFALLTELVDRVAMKTRARSTSDLLAVVPARGEAVRCALEEWQMRELIRQRIDPDTAEPVWSLDHDYLCRGVLAAERRADRWRALLRDGRAEFDAARGSLSRRWRALLPPLTQFRLLIERMRGRLTFGAERVYAAVSVVRFAPFFAGIAVAILAFGYWRAQSTDARARAIVDAMGVERGSLSALWAEDEATALSTIRQAVHSVSAAERVPRLASELAHYAVQLDPHRRQRVIDEVLVPCLEEYQRMPTHRACVSLALALNANERAVVRGFAWVTEHDDRSTSTRRNEGPRLTLHMPWSRFVARSDPALRLRAARLAIETGAVEGAILKQACAALGMDRCLSALFTRETDRDGAKRTAALLRELNIAPDSPAARKARAGLLQRVREGRNDKENELLWLSVLGVEQLDAKTRAELGTLAVRTAAHEFLDNGNTADAIEAIPFPGTLADFESIATAVRRDRIMAGRHTERIAVTLFHRLPAAERPDALAMLRAGVLESDSHRQKLACARVLAELSPDFSTWVDLLLGGVERGLTRIEEEDAVFLAKNATRLSADQRKKLTRTVCTDSLTKTLDDSSSFGGAFAPEQCSNLVPETARLMTEIVKPVGGYGRWERSLAIDRLERLLRNGWVTPAALQPLRDRLPSLRGDAAIVVASLLLRADPQNPIAPSVESVFWRTLDEPEFQEWDDATVLLARFNDERALARVATSMASAPRRYFTQRYFRREKPDGAAGFFIAAVRLLQPDVRTRVLATLMKSVDAEALSTSETIMPMLQELGQAVSAQLIVQTLRQKTCLAGCEWAARELLAQQTGRTFMNAWEVLEWAERDGRLE